MDDSSEVVFKQQSGAGQICLNRPKALNALTLNMCHAMIDQLQQWSEDQSVHIVTIEGAGEKGFCAGGDIRALYDSGKTGTSLISDFYANEYRLDTLIKEYSKPYIALMDGITMGGGVGVSVNGAYRIVTENTLFAMPETSIGLFPDVGGTYFLPRLPGQFGMYLGLTGARLKAADCLHVGIATHFVEHARLEDLKEALCTASAETCSSVLDAYSADPGEAPLTNLRKKIDDHFGQESISAIMQSLKAGGSDWAVKTREILSGKSPTSLCLTHEQLTRGRNLSFRECMLLEYRLTQRIMAGHDFYEGVRAVIIDKDQNPQWQPSTLNDVAQDMIDAHFDTLGDAELSLEINRVLQENKL